jgi:hypothetical protein
MTYTQKYQKMVAKSLEGLGHTPQDAERLAKVYVKDLLGERV